MPPLYWTLQVLQGRFESDRVHQNGAMVKRYHATLSMSSPGFNSP